MKLHIVTLLIASITCLASLHSVEEHFKEISALEHWGHKNVSLDNTMSHTDDGSSSLHLKAGSRANLKISDSMQTGTVSFWLKENMHVNADPKKAHAGPRWGIVDNTGRFFGMGILYIKYLAGDSTYTVANIERSGGAFSNVQYTASKRSVGWHKWTLAIDSNRLLSIHIDGVLNKRLDAQKINCDGISSLSFVGDKAGGSHQIWIDDLSYELGEELSNKKVAALTPISDPEIQARIHLVDAVKGNHPRLLFTADDIPAIRELAKNKGATFFERLEKYVPSCKKPNHTKFHNDATDGQRQGLWRLPTVSLHYVITEDPKSLNQATEFLRYLVELENWELGEEQDFGMSSANIMIGVALAYDMLYNDLEPIFREQCRKKLLLMARRQYYRGHMGLAKSTQYWQGDPANNHRWHRNAGMALAVLAAADDVNGANDYQWILEKTKTELDYVNKWLPEDGTSHESPSYLVFGLTHLCLFTDAADRCLGTNYQKHQAFKNFPYFRTHTLTPGMNKTFAYGDSNEDAIGGYNHAFFFCTRAHQDKEAQASIEALMKQHPKAFDFGWFGLVWYDSSLAEGNTTAIEREILFPDIGVSIMRDGWKDQDVAMMLKCGPYGGYGLNTFRNNNNFKYVNIAHDDPDANEIIIFARGSVFLKPDNYSYKKRTQDHNTLIVNNKGQIASDSIKFTQPPKGMDLTKLSYTTTWKRNNKGYVITEGEAGPAYADISGFRRSVIWAPGDYIMIIDSINAEKENDLNIQFQGAHVNMVDQHNFEMEEDNDILRFTYASNQKTQPTIVDSQAQHRNKIIGYKQLQIHTTAQNWCLVTVFDPWNKRPSVQLTTDENGGTATVSCGNNKDTWDFTYAQDITMPSTITGMRAGVVLISCDEKNNAPRHKHID